MPLLNSRSISPKYAYLAAVVLAFVSWYGWSYEIVFYGGDLAYYGPAARLAGWLTWPITQGINFLPPENPLTTVFLIWLLWLLVMKLLIGAWNWLASTPRHDGANAR